MIFGGGFVGLVVFAFWVWALFDVISTDQARIRNLPKGMWLVIVLFFSAVGSLAWLLLGRPEGASFAVGGGGRRGSSGTRRPRQASSRWDPRIDTRVGTTESDRERIERERREHYAELEAELDRRIEERDRRDEGDS